jgi:hypothetical protein
MSTRGRKPLNDQFTDFAQWMIADDFSANTANIYASTLRAASRVNADLDAYSHDLLKSNPSRYGVFMNALKAWNQYKEADLSSFPLDVQLAIKVIDRYNKEGEGKIELKY